MIQATLHSSFKHQRLWIDRQKRQTIENLGSWEEKQKFDSEEGTAEGVSSANGKICTFDKKGLIP